MKNNEFEIFDNAGDDMIEKISEDYPVLTDEEKKRMFAMSERKFNISESKDEAEVVSGVERYRKPVWHRYAAMAAALVLVFGGIGGTLFLGRRMVKSAPEKSPAAQTPEITSGTEPAQPVADHDAVAAQLVENYRRFSKYFIFDPGYEMSSDPIDIKISCNGDQDSYMVRAVKVTDPSVQSEDDLKAIVEAAWDSDMTERIMLDYFGGDLTEKIKGELITESELKSFFLYNGDLYCTTYGMGGSFGDTISLTTEDIDENSFLVHWKYIAYPYTEADKTMLVSNRIEGWRITECVNGTYYAGSPSTNELYDAATKLFSGYSNVYNKIHGADFNDVDEEDILTFHCQNFDPIYADKTDNAYTTYDYTYARVTDPEISTSDAFYSFISRIKHDHLVSMDSIINDVSEYPEDTIFTGSILKVDDDDVSESVLTQFVIKDGKVYARCTSKESMVPMRHDPQIIGIHELGPNDAFIETDEDTAMLEMSLESTNGERYGYMISREDTGVWQITGFAPAENVLHLNY